MPELAEIERTTPQEIRRSLEPCTVRSVPDEPLARLPDEIVLSRDEAAVVLFGLDVVERADLDADEAAKVTRAVHLLTAKLWPDLGDLLNDDDEA